MIGLTYAITLPNIEKTIEDILEAPSKPELEDSIKLKPIREYLLEYRTQVENNRKMSRDKIFMRFVINLLARQTTVVWWEPVHSWLEKQIQTISNIPKLSKLEKGLRDRKYRFWPDGAKVILETKTTFLNQLGGDWKQYFTTAEANHQADYPNDPFLKIKNVKFKVRDLALSNFSTKFMALDSHVMDVLKRTGLLLYAYPWGYEFFTKPDTHKRYLTIHKICLKLAKKAKLEPMEFDRALWHFGRDICSNPPACKTKGQKCPVASNCLTYSFLFSD